MLCDECMDITNDYQTIANSHYCNYCVNKYMLSRCPGGICNNIISLNGYDELTDIENNTCTSCDTVFCDSCLVRAKNLKMCNECFNS